MQAEQTILLVDGSAADRRRVREALGRVAPYFTCLEAADLESALRILGETPVDCIVADHLFPGGSALELLKRSVDTPWDATATVVLTNADSEPLAARLLAAGAQDYLVKARTDATRLRRSIAFSALRRRAAQEQLAGTGQSRRLQQLGAIGRLARGVAHEFNNILMVVMGLAEMLYLEASDESEQRDDLMEILDAGRRGQKLTRQLLAFGRTDMSRPMVMDVERLVTDSKKLIDELTPVGITVQLSVDGGPHLVKGDHSQLQQMLVDLCLHSAGGMPDGGDIVLCMTHWTPDDEQELPQVIVSVTDSGAILDEETCKHIFEPFFTVPGRPRTGLGLAPVFGIAKQHGGHIEVDSSEGDGTTYKIYLPAAEAVAHHRGGVGRSNVTAGSAITVLLVEDESSVRRIAARWLSSQGYHVVEAVDGLDGLTRYDALRGAVDVLVSDCQMPKLGGEELASRLRSRQPDLPVLLMTGYVETATLQELFGSGNIYFLRKPFSGETLVDAVADLLNPPV